MRKILYLSYDGLTDPLGKSQILPYIKELSKDGYEYHIISFEKPDRYRKNGEAVRQELAPFPVKWHPEEFTSSPPFISKFRDLKVFRQSAENLCKEYEIQLIHCRSYVSAQVAQRIKKRLNIPYLFDVRGFWVDERKDKGIWQLNNPAHKLLYHYYKIIEKKLIRDADHIITLTEASARFINSEWKIPAELMTVIPCSVETTDYTIADTSNKAKAKEELNIPKDEFCLGYLGSLGGWYDLDRMLCFYSDLLNFKENAHFIFYTPHEKEDIIAKARKYNISTERIHVFFVPHQELDKALNAFDVSILFLKDVFSIIACSPARIGELWAKGIAVILSEGIGDLTADFIDGSGVITSNPKDIDHVLHLSEEDIRNKAIQYFNLENAVKKYKSVYSRLV